MLPPQKSNLTEQSEAQVSLQKWLGSADAWIRDQGTSGDWSRRRVLDPVLDNLLTDLTGKRVLDLGCGEGRYARVLKKKGAEVIGVDPIPAFIKRAQALDAQSTYLEATAESLPVADGTCDLVLSYLSFIDIADLESASREIGRVLKPAGELIVVSLSNFASATEGWIKGPGGRKLYRKVDRYMEHFGIDVEWRGIRIRNYHRPLSYILGLFLERGFVLTRFLEPLPPSEDRNYADEFRAPNFQIYSLKRISE